jgi:hypothetical protein
MAIADFARSLTVGAAIAATLWLAASHHLRLASAVAGTAALIMLGGRIAFAGQSAGMLQESAMFVNDFLAFARLAPPVTARVSAQGSRADARSAPASGRSRRRN